MGTKKEAIYNLHLGKKMDTKKEALYKKVLKEVKAGSTQADACKKFGVPRSTFSAWKGRQASKPKVKRRVEKKATINDVTSPPKLIDWQSYYGGTVSENTTETNDISVVVLKGDSKAIAKALKGVL